METLDRLWDPTRNVIRRLSVCSVTLAARQADRHCQYSTPVAMKYSEGVSSSRRKSRKVQITDALGFESWMLKIYLPVGTCCACHKLGTDS